MKAGSSPVLVVGLLLSLYCAFAILGPGNDNDTYAMLETWHSLATSFEYAPSRGPGNPLPELTIGAAYALGGYYAANFISAALAAATLWLWWELLSGYCPPPVRLLVLAAIGVNPTWIILAATAMDHIYAVFFWTLGVWCLHSRRCAWAGVALACCVASRLGYLPVCAVLFVIFPLWPAWRDPPRLSRYLAGATVFAGISLIAYLPSALHYGSVINAMRPYDPGEFQLLRHAGSFLHGNLLIWGLPSLLLLTGAALLAIRDSRLARSDHFFISPLPTVFAAALVYHLVLYLKFPLEWKYLLPTIPLAISVICLLLAGPRREGRPVQFLLGTVIGLQVLHAAVSLQVFSFAASPAPSIDVALTGNPVVIAGRSTTGEISLGLFLKDGIILRDVLDRSSMQSTHMKLYEQRRLSAHEVSHGVSSGN
ncbi:MAG: hypothetical protein GEU92_04185 [Alphaproteobacteria bacterium]|nr:hypothetical protein [Alphaproteobacteria bacterium]